MLRFIAGVDADVFIADERSLQLLGAYLDGLPRTQGFGRDVLLLAVPKGNPKFVQSLEDVGELPPEAVCTPPYMLQGSVVPLDQLEVPLNEEAAADCGTTTMDALVAGDLDAAVVPGSAVGYLRLARPSRIRLPVAGSLVVPYRMVLLSDNDAARGFMNFVSSDIGRSHHHPVRIRVTSSAPGQAPTELVCLTGMHRSGTSLLARVASLLGVDLGAPDVLMGPGPDNPAGYWENRAIKELDDELLAHLGGAWDQPPLLESGWPLDPGLDPFRERALEDLGPRPGPSVER